MTTSPIFFHENGSWHPAGEHDSSVPEAVIDNVFSSTLLDGDTGCLYSDAHGAGDITDIDTLNDLDEDSYNPSGSVYGNTYELPGWQATRARGGGAGGLAA